MGADDGGVVDVLGGGGFQDGAATSKAVEAAADVTRPPTVARIVAAVRGAAAGGARLIVLPELAPSGCCFVDRAEAAAAAESLDGPTISALRGLSADLSVTIVCGVALREDDHVFNTAVAVEEGKLLGVYRKSHQWGIEKDQFDAGDQGPVVLDSRCGALALLACYNLEFPELARLAVEGGAEVVKAQAAAAYYGPTSSPRIDVAPSAGLAGSGAASSSRPPGSCWLDRPTSREIPTILFAGVNPLDSRDKTLGPHNDRMLDRREALYRLEHLHLERSIEDHLRTGRS